MLFAVTGLLLPSRLQSLSLCPVETMAAPGGARRICRRQGREALAKSLGLFMELSGIEPLSETPV